MRDFNNQVFIGERMQQNADVQRVQCPESGNVV